MKSCGSVYTGQTKQYLKNCIFQHLTNIKKPITQHKSLTNHCTEFSYQFDYDNVKIIYNERITKNV